MTINTSFNAEFARQHALLTATTDDNSMEATLTAFTELFDKHPLLKNFRSLPGNNYYDGMGASGRVFLEMVNYISPTYAIELQWRIQADVNLPMAEAQVRLAHFIDNRGANSRNIDYIERVEPPAIKVVHGTVDVVDALIATVCSQTEDILTDFVKEQLDEQQEQEELATA